MYSYSFLRRAQNEYRQAVRTGNAASIRAAEKRVVRNFRRVLDKTASTMRDDVAMLAADVTADDSQALAVALKFYTY